MTQIELSTSSALVPKDDKSDVLLAEGPAGAGKTRLGFEVLRRLAEPDGALQELLTAADGSRTVAVGLYIDFNNEFALNHDVDSINMDENMAVRLAARYLCVSMSEVRTLNGGTLNGLSTSKVLSAIVNGVLDRAASTSSMPSPPNGVLLAVHLDEYQAYLEALTKRKRVSAKTISMLPRFRKEAVMECFKEMLSAINNWAREPANSVRARVSFLPVVSGTPVTGLELKVTDKLTEVPFRPDRLDNEDAVALVADVICADKRGINRKKVLKLLASQEARMSMADVDFRPRFLVTWGTTVKGLVTKARSGSPIVLDWAVASSEVFRRVPGSRSTKACEVLALLVLSQTHVPRNVLYGGRALSTAFKILASAVQSGEVEASLVNDRHVVVRVPLVQLRRWPVAHVFPPSLFGLLSSPWQDAEFALAYCLRARLTPELRSTPLTVQGVFSGARGASAVPDLELVLHRPRGVYVQTSQLFSMRESPFPGQPFHVTARRAHGVGDVEAVDVRENVILTCAGSKAVDLYTVVPFSREEGGHLYVIVQTKKTDNAITVSLSDIQKWYDTVFTLTKKWRRDGNEVMYMFFTNKRLTDEAKAMMDQQFFLERPGLCVTSFDELDEVIPSLMRTRFVTAEQERRFS